MNHLTLTFLNRQLQVRTNSFLRLLTSFGEVFVQYVPCSERFSIRSGCTNWTYTFCVQDCDIPAGLSICALTEDVLVPPYLEAISLVFEDSPTAEVNGAGTELNPYRVDVRIDEDPDNDLTVLAGGLFVQEEGTPGAPGANGADGTNGANGAGPPVGSVFYIPGTTAPINTEPLFGQILNRITEPELWAFAAASGNLIGEVGWLADPLNRAHFSTGDGVNTFRVPDLRGYFLRPMNNDVSGPDPSRGIGTIQGDAIRNITASVLLDDTRLDNLAGAFELGAAHTEGTVNTEVVAANELAFDASNVVPTADENRPVNAALMAVIQSRSVV